MPQSSYAIKCWLSSGFSSFWDDVDDDTRTQEKAKCKQEISSSETLAAFMLFMSVLLLLLWGLSNLSSMSLEGKFSCLKEAWMETMHHTTYTFPLFWGIFAVFLRALFFQPTFPTPSYNLGRTSGSKNKQQSYYCFCFSLVRHLPIYDYRFALFYFGLTAVKKWLNWQAEDYWTEGKVISSNVSNSRDVWGQRPLLMEKGNSPSTSFIY